MTTHRMQISFVLTAACVLHVVILIMGVSQKPTPSHDGVISFIAATGHQHEYHAIVSGQLEPYGTWANASDWQQFWQMNRQGAFVTIGRDLARHDLHPPLYFWLMHVAMLIGGATISAALAVNVIIGLITIFVLYGFATRILRSSTWGALAALLWAISPGALTASTQMRQYPLYALCALVMCWSLMRLLAGRRVRRITLMWLFIAVLGGLLTHYHFIVVLAIGLVYVLCASGRHKRSRSLTATAICVFAVLGAWLLHPTFYLSFTGQGTAVPDFSQEELLARLQRVAEGTGHLFFYGKPGWMEWFMLAAAVVLVGRLLIRPTRRFAGLVRDARFWSMVYFALALWGFTSLAYLAMQSPAHAIGHRYYALVWPLGACMVIAIVRSWPRREILLGLVLIVMGYNTINVVNGLHRSYRKAATGCEVVAAAEYIVIDDMRRGMLPQMLWTASPQAKVLAATGKRLLATPQVQQAPIGRTLLMHVPMENMPTAAQLRDAIWPGAKLEPAGQLLSSSIQLYHVVHDAAEPR